ncbi:MAG: CBS domain-containing protein [Alphaproteobacteria bacterium]
MHVEIILKTKGRHVATVLPDETVANAAARLRQDGIGAMVVSTDGVTVLGILSERDICHAVADHGPSLGAKRVEELMTRDVVTCAPGDTIAGIMAVMSEKRFRHLPVIEDGRMCGIVSIGDVVKYRLEEVEHDADAMREYIAGA